MNISEACDVQAVLEFVTGLTLFEHPNQPDDSRLHGAIERLAARSQARLGAGMSGPDAVAAALRSGVIL